MAIEVNEVVKKTYVLLLWGTAGQSELQAQKLAVVLVLFSMPQNFLSANFRLAHSQRVF